MGAGRVIVCACLVFSFLEARLLWWFSCVEPATCLGRPEDVKVGEKG